MTPFNGIQELLPGMGLFCNENGTYSSEQLWNLEACTSSFIGNEVEFEQSLLSTLQSTVKAWTRDSAGICVELSGGTDSSGLLILLRDILPADRPIIGVNYFDSMAPSANEKQHAQAIADACNIPLYFIDWNNSSVLDSLPEAWRPNKPSSFLLFHKTNQELFSLAQHNNCSEIIDGHGGDHVFLAPRPIDALADYWLDHGIKGILAPMQELVSANRMPYSFVIKKNVQSIADYYGLKKDYKVYDSTFFNIERVKNENNSFFLEKNIKNFYPAKRKHVHSLFHALAYASLNQRIPGYTITHPFFSQPIVEAGLKIPTYQSFKAGYDRIFFRNAISRIKQFKTVWRTEKGETTSSVIKPFSKCALDIYDIITDGFLFKSGLINKQWLYEQIMHIKHGHANNLWPVQHMLSSQLWINQWKL